MFAMHDDYNSYQLQLHVANILIIQQKSRS